LTDFASLGQGTATFVDFDFGAPTLISRIVYTDRTSSGGANGSGAGGSGDNVTGYDLIFSDNSIFGDAGDVTVSVLSPGFGNTDPPVLINGGVGLTSRFVRFDVTGTSGGANVGGAEIEFFTTSVVPEPSSLWTLLSGVGLLGCDWLRRKRAGSQHTPTPGS